MAKKIDLTGQRFGRLVVLNETENKNGRTRWNCLCDCGNYYETTTKTLRNGTCKSCGCYRNELSAKRLELIPLQNKKDWGKILGAEYGKITGKITGPVNVKKMIKANKKENLKENTNLGRIASKKMQKNNVSNVKGVHKNLDGYWIANISFKKEKIYLGCFKNKQDAINARKEAEEKYFQPILEKYGKESK